MMETKRFMSVWKLSPQGSCIPISHKRILSELEALCPTEPGQETLNRLVIDHLVEVTCKGEYILTKRGMQIRALVPDASVSRNSMPKRTGHEWDRFRKILSYYIDCVHLQERTQEYFRNTDLNRRFFIPPLPLHWLKTVGQESSFHVPFSLAQKAAAQILLTRQDDDEEIYLGYPLAAFFNKSRKETCYTPIGLIPVEIISSKLRELTIDLKIEEAEINQTWLEYAFPREDHSMIMNAILGLHKNDEHSGKIDLLNALPLLQKNAVFDPENLSLILPSLNSNDKEQLCNSAILFVGQPLRFSKTLKRELKFIRDNISDEVLDATALAYIFREPVLSAVQQEKHFMPLPFIESNPEQMVAIEAALNSPSVKVTGPPGTGKSQVAVNIIANLIFQGKSVLFTSRNHKAVEAIWERSKQLIHEPGLSLVNFCTQQDPNPWYKQDLDILMAGAGAVNCNPIDDSIHRVQDAAEHWGNIAQHYAPRRAILTEYETWNREFQKILQSMQRLFDTASHEPLTKQEFLLLKRNINRLSERPHFPNKQINSWIKWYFGGSTRTKRAKKYLTHHYSKAWENAVNITELKQNFCKFESFYNYYRQLEKKKKLLLRKVNTLPDIHQGERQLRETMKDIAALLPIALLMTRCNKIKELTDNPDLVNRLKNIMTFMKSANSPAFFQRLKTKDAEQAEMGFQIFSQFYPGWAVTLLSLTKAAPCIAHHFDTVIIDEASQCDPASIIPALFRAKSIVLVGDSNQFPPVIDMKPLRNEYLKNKNEITSIVDQRFDFLNTSAFDLSSISPILLKEHFRCAEEIADYFNSVFYANQLHIRTDRSHLCTPECMGFHHAVEWIDIRNSKEDELQATYKTLEKLIMNNYPGSIGVVTPFREYANLLKEKLRPLISKLQNNDDEEKLAINTANGFQGGERDVMIFVLGYNDSLNKGQFWYAESQENRYIYNVAVSRARACLIIIGDKERCKASSVPVLNKLAQMPRQKAEQTDIKQFDSIWEKRFFEALKSAGIETLPQYPLVGRRLDLAYIHGDIKIDIEIDGVHYHTTDDGFRKMDDFYRDLQVQAVGWQVRRFWVYELQEDIDKCVKEIKKMI